MWPIELGAALCPKLRLNLKIAENANVFF